MESVANPGVRRYFERTRERLGVELLPMTDVAPRLRERLRPYIMAQMKLASTKGTPPMRPLFFDFADDKNCAAADDQFMFGPAIMVNPVTHAGATGRLVHLPASAAGWFDFWTNTRQTGGQTITWTNTNQAQFPLFVREGAIVPLLLTDDRQNTIPRKPSGPKR